jgi:hypothetical protein
MSLSSHEEEENNTTQEETFVDSEEEYYEEEEDDEEEDDEDEPKLRYRRVGASVKDILEKDTASTIKVSDKFMVQKKQTKKKFSIC